MKNLIMTFAIVSKLVSGCGDGASPSGIPALPEQQTTEQVDEKTNKDKKSGGSEIVPEATPSPVAVARAATTKQAPIAPDGLDTVSPQADVTDSAPVGSQLMFTDPGCITPEPSQVQAGVSYMRCDRSMAVGTRAAETVTVQMPGTVETVTVQVPGPTVTVTPAPAPTVTVTPAPIPNCTGNRQIGCVTTATYESANLASIGPANIRENIVIAGVTGTMVEGIESHTDCTGNGQVGCITTATHKSADFTNILACKIKKDTWVAGVLGDYPSANCPLRDSTSTSDLDLASFNEKLASAAAFEWFDSAGARYSNNGTTTLTAANIMTGVTVFGALGTLSPGEQPNAWDIRKGVSINGIDGLAKMSCRSDTSNVDLKCDYASWDSYALVDGHTTKTDRITGLMWTAVSNGSTMTKAWANTLCTNLASSTGEAWRVPSLSEINTAYVHQIDWVFGTKISNAPNGRIWSSEGYNAASKTEAVTLLDSVTSTSAVALCVKNRASY